MNHDSMLSGSIPTAASSGSSTVPTYEDVNDANRHHRLRRRAGMVGYGITTGVVRLNDKEERKRAKSADQASLGTAGTLEAGCNGSMALPRTRLELGFKPYRGSSAECRIRSRQDSFANAHGD